MSASFIHHRLLVVDADVRHVHHLSILICPHRLVVVKPTFPLKPWYCLRFVSKDTLSARNHTPALTPLPTALAEIARDKLQNNDIVFLAFIREAHFINPFINMTMSWLSHLYNGNTYTYKD